MIFVCTAGHVSRTSPCPHCPVTCEQGTIDPHHNLTPTGGTMSQTKHALESAAELLDVPIDVLTDWVMNPGAEDPGPRPSPRATLVKAARLVGLDAAYLAHRMAQDGRRVPGDDRADDLDALVAERTARDGIVREVVRNARGAPLAILEHRGLSGQTASTLVRPAAELVSEDDYRGVAADLIARWADDHVDAATVLGSLNLAAHGMPVTTPSRRALAKIRDEVNRALRHGDEPRIGTLSAILDEVGA